MALSSYQRFCYRIFGKLAENAVTENLKLNLEKANINIRAGVYLACSWMNTIIAIVASAVALVFIFGLILPALNVNLLSGGIASIFVILLLALAPFGIGFLVHFLYLSNPSSIAKKRGKKIDNFLPYALNFIATMSAAGITPHEIFISLSKQGIYGEVKEEATKIGRDITLLGMDIVTALKRAMERTPSERFKEFLQGAVVTITSGGALKPYFMSKAQQYMRENQLTQKKFIEDLGVMAETYVVAAVVLPLLLLVMLPIMMMTMGSAGRVGGIDMNLLILYIIVFVLLPIIHIGFTVSIMGMTPEVE